MANQQEMQKKLLKVMKEWQDIEDQSVKSTTEIASKTDNPIVKQVMDIIRQDSAMHRKVQQLIIDSLEKQAFHLQPEELGEIWDMVEKHIELEKETIRMAEEARKNSNQILHRYLLGYLLTDEQKHNRILEQMEDIKRGIYPYA
ncbi:MAG: hypothetical protein GF315_08715 [candidate division Zixibacteria bacterium]|nr:hypothetical protein [candidate division Zixibacteria bacterium]